MIRAIYTIPLLLFISLGTIRILAQDHANVPSAINNGTTASAAINSNPAATSTSSSSATAEDASASMSAGDFIIDGVPYAKVLYLEGNVWIRPPNATFHRLAEDEPIPAQSVIYTGFNGTLDFATGPGMAVRMVPGTLVTVNQLPQPPAPAPAASTPNAPTPEPAASEVGVKKGTIFSALGCEDGQPIDFKVRTPEGVAGARGTMFSTTTSGGQSEVDMLHGTVSFQTPDQQTSQITAGQSQQISGSPGARYQLGQQRSLSPVNSDAFFNHAGGLLEHASGYGVVRHGLGPDIARTLQARGYKLGANFQQRFQNAGKLHYRNRPMFNRTHAFRPAGAAPGGRTLPRENNRPATAPATNYHPTPQNVNPRPKPEMDRTERRHRRENGE